MASRKAVVDAVIAKIAEAAEIAAADIYTRPLIPSDLADGNPKVAVVRVREGREREDDGLVLQTLSLEIGVAVRMDPGSSSTLDEQLEAIIDPARAQLEEIADGDAASGIIQLLEDDAGVEWDMADAGNSNVLRSAISEWTLTYNRTMGATE